MRAFYMVLAVALAVGCAPETDAPTDTGRSLVMPDGWTRYNADHADDIPVMGAYPLMLCAWGEGPAPIAEPPTSWRIDTLSLSVTCPDEARDLWVGWVE